MNPPDRVKLPNRMRPPEGGSDALGGAAWLVVLLLGSCSHYTTSAGLVGGIRSVAIPTAENGTPEVDIAQQFTDSVSVAFQEDGRLRVVDEESADALLLLRLDRLEDEYHTMTTGEYRFRLFVSALLERTSDGSELLEIESLVGWGTYDAAQPDEEGRELAVAAAMAMIIEEIVDRVTASW